MKATVAVALLTAWISVGAARAAQPAGATRHGPAGDRDAILATKSFLDSAMEMTCSPRIAPARAGRLVVLTRFADRLAPGDWRPDRLLADIYLAQGDPNAEIGAMEAYLANKPHDYAVRLRWINARLRKLQNAEDRSGFLESLADRKDIEDAARGWVLAALADLQFGQGRTADAAKTAAKAIAMDPCGAGPLAAWARAGDANSPTDSMAMDLRLVRGQPRAFNTAWKIALTLTELGLHEKAIEFYEPGWLANMGEKDGVAISTRMASQYGSALLDANRPRQAVKVLEHAGCNYVANSDLESLLVEAYTAAGEVVRAASLVDGMTKTYKDRASAGSTSESLSAELGWFYAVTQPRPNLAIIYAERAVLADPNNFVYQRILGAAEMLGKKTDQAIARLKPLVGKDIYASVLLAEQYERSGEKDKLRRAILAGAPLAGSGPAARKLQKIAARHHVELPVTKNRHAVAELVKDFPTECLTMVSDPNDCISVVLSGVGDRDSLVCGEAIEVAATLKNVGSADLPLGEMGAMNPRMVLAVSVADARGQTLAKTNNLPLALWPAPRYLSPGRTITCRVRLDTCEIAAAIATHPLDDLTITVTGVVDPGADGKSRLPGLTVKPVTIRRRGLLGPIAKNTPDGWLAAYKLALGRVVRDYRRGTPTQRMRAARQIGSLVTFATEAQHSRIVPPGMLRGQIDRLVILAMLRAILSDRSPAVRAEAVASLRSVRPDELVISLLAPRVRDRDPMVRCRLVELLAVTNSKGHDTIVEVMANDSDPLVREMAKTFQAR